MVLIYSLPVCANGGVVLRLQHLRAVLQPAVLCRPHRRQQQQQRRRGEEGDEHAQSGCVREKGKL